MIEAPSYEKYLFNRALKLLINNNIYKFESLKQGKQKPVSHQTLNTIFSNNVLSFQSDKLTDALKAQGLCKINDSKGYKELQTFDVPFYPHIQGKIYELNNGQQVVIIPKPGPIVLQTTIKAGSLNKPDELRGISHFIEHSLFNGSKKFPGNSFDLKASKMGVETNAETGIELTSYYILSTIPEEFEESLEMHSDMLQNPVFTDQSIEKEKDIVIKEIQEYANEPELEGSNKALNKLFNIKSTSNDLTLGREDNIRNLTKEDVTEYYNKWYRPDNMTTFIIGSVEPEKTMQLMQKHFNKTKPNTPIEKPITLTPLTQAKVSKTKSSKVNNTTLEVLLPITTNDNLKEIMCFELLTKVLTDNKNSILSKEFDGINSFPESLIETFARGANNNLYLTIGASLNDGDEKIALKLIQKAFKQLSTQEITPKQLQIAKNKCENEFSITSETTQDLVQHLSRALINYNNLNYYTDKKQLLQSITAKDIKEIAQKYLALNKASISFVYPKNHGINISAKQINQGPISFTGNVTSSFNINNVKKEVLPNNVVLAINDDPNAIRTTAQIQIQTNELPLMKPGINYILGLMLGKDSKNYTEEKFLEIQDLNNIELELIPGIYSYKIQIDCPKEKLTQALELAKEKLFNVSFKQESLNKVKKEFQLTLNGEGKDAEENGDAKLYKDHPYGYTLDDLKKSIPTITIEELKDYYEALFNNQTQVTSAITGQISSVPNLKEEITTFFTDTFSTMTPFKIFDKSQISLLTKNTVVVDIEETDQAEIIQKIPFIMEDNVKDFVGMQLFNSILGGNGTSRLFTDLREKQKLAYSVNSGFIDTEHQNHLSLSINTSIYDEVGEELIPTFDNIKNSLEGFKANLQQLFDKPVSKEELEAAKRKMHSELILSSEKSKSKTNKVMLYLRTKESLDYLNQLKQELETITPSDIQKIAKKYLENKPSVISILSDEDAIMANKNYIESLGELKLP